MSMYVLQTKIRAERTVAEALRKSGFEVFLPETEAYIRRGGKWYKRIVLIFPQYIFVECELDSEKRHRINSIFDVVRLLGSENPEPLSECEEAYIRLLHNDGLPIKTSEVRTDLTGKKTVVSGFLKEHQVDILSVDLRQFRAKVKVTICGRGYRITLPIIAV